MNVRDISLQWWTGQAVTGRTGLMPVYFTVALFQIYCFSKSTNDKSLHEHTFNSDPFGVSHRRLSTLTFGLALKLTAVLRRQVENLRHDLSVPHVIRDCLVHCGEVPAGVSQLSALLSEMRPYNMQLTAELKVVTNIAGQFDR